MSRPHDTHELQYVDNAVVSRSCTLDDDGNVIVGEVVDIDETGDSFVWCDTCKTTIYGGEDGLAEHWETR